MYAFALWDAQRRRLLLARDPYGIKPLYYADDGRTLRFASQVKALLAGGALRRPARDLAGKAGFYLFGSVPEPYTLYQDIRALPAGSTLTIDARGPGQPTPPRQPRRRVSPLHPVSSSPPPSWGRGRGRGGTRPTCGEEAGGEGH